jgi:hypothetical protein
MDLTWVKTIEILMVAASIAQTLVDKQVKFKILSYKLVLGKSLTGLGLKKFKKPWTWACPQKFSTPALFGTINFSVVIYNLIRTSKFKFSF